MSAAAADAPLIFLIAGEASGDVIGAHLMAALKRQVGGAVRFAGVGGDRMAGEGLASLFPIDELAVMGLAEVVPHIPRLLRRIREVADAALAARPAAVVSIDSPDFAFRVQCRLKRIGAPRLHIVAPQVWAYRPARAAELPRFLDHLLVLLPFEPPFFERYGLACTFIGHPSLEEGVGAVDGAAFRARHGIPADAPVLVILPGSRRSVVRRTLAVFLETAARLQRKRPGLSLVLPCVRHLKAEVEAAVERRGLAVTVVEGREEKLGAFAAGTAALTVSGTVSAELAVAGLPMVVGYRMNPLTAAIARRIVKVPYITLVNLILKRQIVPEFVLDACRPERLAPALEEVMVDGPARHAQIEGFKEAVAALRAGEMAPSERAAAVILEIMARRRAERATAKGQ
ncbi:MAG: lipid-A-disaccharide synthase [Alphaproteobacteria bacterium]